MNPDDGAYYNRLYRLWAVMAFGPSSRLLRELSENFDDTETLYTALTQDEATRNSLPARTVKAADDVTLTAAERLLDFCDSKGIGVVTLDDDNYPLRLRQIFNPPSVLFYRGDISGLNDSINVGMVGTRQPSEYSVRVAGSLANELGRNGIAVISGFAEGIDITSQLGCIKGGGLTYSVIGSGIDYEYPKNNMRFYSAIAENGAIISEYLPGTPPASGNFLTRNRILAGISMGVAVIEAGAKSGSLNSAAHCTSQGKPVFCVPPHDLFDERYRGNAALLREGAVPLMSARDIFSEYSLDSQHIIASNEKAAKKLEQLKLILAEAEKARREAARKDRQKSAPKQEKAPDPQPAAVPAEYETDDPLLREIVNRLSEGTKRADELSVILEQDIGDILSGLTELEIDGVISNTGGNYSLA